MVSLSSLVRSIRKHNVLVIGGDMNTQIGKNRNHKSSLHNSSNRNGQHLTDFKIENRLTRLYTNFQKREGKLWTYTYANNIKAHIDYVFVNKKWNDIALNCKVYPSDHRIITAKIRLSPRRNTTRTSTTVYYDWCLLNNWDIRDKYALARRNKFDVLQKKTETHIPNEEYENFVHANLEAAAKYLPTKLKTKPRVPWETLVVREKCADMKTASKCNTNALKIKKAQNEVFCLFF